MDVASGTITLIDAAAKAVRLIIEQHKHYQEVDGTPQAFQEVLNRLPIVDDTLMQFKNEAKYILSENAVATTRNLLQSCQSKADQLREIFETLAPHRGKSRLKRYRLVILRMGSDKKVEVLARLMMDDLDVLVKSYFLRTTTEERLATAIDELSRVPESIKDEDLKDTGSNSGGIANNTGSGRIYSFQGTGNVFTTTIGKD
ncbi:Pfs NACHT ankyrin domain-containing protein [Fusarium napiforme]|uniref:Pfs NACHT ankyrin domain-containing protein n=1 Tax=Fusarium napiforme TaxID=42672 RepID=A0A8H5MIY5_9HYPO|nr:Pfs NACHT ankyrin domain-containing protein [Fusarium napiforme]